MRHASDVEHTRGLNHATRQPPRRSALVFAGGRATRLGGVNKALLEVGGVRIVDRIFAALGPLVDERIILTNDSSLGDVPGARLVFDPSPHAGVLPALAAGLAEARAELCLAVACDMPFVSGDVFQRLLEVQRTTDADVVIPRVSEQFEPMHAVYRRTPVLAAIQAALARSEQRMISYFASVRVHEWREAAEAYAFFNVNTPADLEEARRLAESRT